MGAFREWKIEEHLKTPEERNAYLLAAAEEGTADAIPDAFADVFRSMGKEAEAAVCEALAAYLRNTGKGTLKGARARRRQESTAGRLEERV